MIRHGLNVPCHWDRRIMEQMLQKPVADGELPIIEVYGSLAKSSLMHGRASSTVPSVTAEEAVAFLQLLRTYGVAFTYLLNAPYLEEKHGRREELREYLEWILGDLRPDALTISSLPLMQFVREMDRNIPIHVSTIAGVRSVGGLEEFLCIHPNRIVPHHDLGKDWKALDDVVRCAEKNSVEVELLVTESCLFSCPIRDAHYSHIAQPANATDLNYHEWCKKEKEHSPGEYLCAGGAIRPEDLHLLEQRGVRIFKISGRDRPAEEMPEVVSAYQQRKYDGDFFSLMDVAPAVKDKYPYISNRALNGFLEKYPQESTRHQKAYCAFWIARLREEGNFQIR